MWGVQIMEAFCRHTVEIKKKKKIDQYYVTMQTWNLCYNVKHIMLKRDNLFQKENYCLETWNLSRYNTFNYAVITWN